MGTALVSGHLTVAWKGFNIVLDWDGENKKLSAFSQDENGIQITYKNENNANKTKKISWEEVFPEGKK